LGNTSPVIVALTRTWTWSRRCAVGILQLRQVCISVQRIYAQQDIYQPSDKFVQASEAMVVGDPLTSGLT
jgi:acyl-CoA reductase-like NAD-dependent aldehyde dehydrogenase